MAITCCQVRLQLHYLFNFLFIYFSFYFNVENEPGFSYWLNKNYGSRLTHLIKLYKYFIVVNVFYILIWSCFILGNDLGC